MELKDLDTNRKTATREASYTKHIKARVAQPQFMCGIVTRTSNLIVQKIKDGYKEKFVIDVLLHDDNWAAMKVEGHDDDGNKVIGDFVVSKWVGAWMSHPKENNVQWLVNIFEMAGTMPQFEKVKEGLSKIPDPDKYVNYVVEEMLRRSLEGRRVMVDVANTKGAKDKNGKETEDAQYAVVMKFGKIMGDVPNCLTPAGKPPIIDAAIKLYDDAEKRAVRKEEYAKKEAPKSPPAPAPVDAPAPVAAPVVPVVPPKVESAPVSDHAKVLMKKMNIAIDMMRRVFDMSDKRDAKKGAALRKDGLSEMVLYDELQQQHHFTDDEIKEVISALHFATLIIEPRSGQWTFGVNEPAAIIEDAVGYLEAMAQPEEA